MAILGLGIGQQESNEVKPELLPLGNDAHIGGINEYGK